MINYENKSHICFYSAFFYPHVGGLENYVLQLSLKLIEHGYTVSVVTNNTNKVADTECYMGINIYRIPSWELKFGNSGVLPFPRINRDFFRLSAILKEQKFDFIITNTRFFLINHFGLYFIHRKVKSIIHLEHGSGYIKLNNPILDFFSIKYDKILVSLLKRKIKIFCGVSNASNLFLASFGIDPSVIIPSAIVFNKPIHSVDYKQIHQIPDNAILITFVGRIITEKGIEYLVEAFSNISKNMNDAYLFVAGNGVLLEELTSLYRHPKIIFLGHLNENEINSLLQISDIFVNPSFAQEGGQRSLLEAAINKCAIISTNVGNVSEVIEHKKSGLIIGKKSSKDITEAIIFLMEHPELIKDFAEKSYQQVNNNFNWDVTLTNFNKMLVKSQIVN